MRFLNMQRLKSKTGLCLFTLVFLGVLTVFALGSEAEHAAAESEPSELPLDDAVEAAEAAEVAEAGENNAGGSNSTVAVEGEGQVEVEPEIAYLTLGVETSDEDPRTAQEENTEIMENVVAALKGLGIAEEDIRSGHYSIHQRPARDEEEPPEYRVRNQLEVTVRDLDEVGPALSVAVEEGVNHIPGLEFGLDPETEETYKLEALELALAHAETKAERIADFYPQSLGPVRQVNETDVSFQRMQMDMDMPREVAEEMERADMEAAYGMEAMPADPEKLSFEASVDVIYYLD